MDEQDQPPDDDNPTLNLPRLASKVNRLGSLLWEMVQAPWRSEGGGAEAREAIQEDEALLAHSPEPVSSDHDDVIVMA